MTTFGRSGTDVSENMMNAFYYKLHGYYVYDKAVG